MINIDNETILMEKYKLTPDELYCVKLILLASEESSIDYLIRFTSISAEHRELFKKCLVSLREKEIILKSYKIPKSGQQFIPEDVKFNKNFLKNFFRASFDMGQELFNAYPPFAMINGSNVMLRSISKKFNSLEDAYAYYGKCIKWNPETHREILELISWSKDFNILNCSLGSFIVDNKWIDLKELRDKGNTNYNTIKML